MDFASLLNPSPPRANNTPPFASTSSAVLDPGPHSPRPVDPASGVDAATSSAPGGAAVKDEEADIELLDGRASGTRGEGSGRDAAGRGSPAVSFASDRAVGGSGSPSRRAREDDSMDVDQDAVIELAGRVKGEVDTQDDEEVARSPRVRRPKKSRAQVHADRVRGGKARAAQMASLNLRVSTESPADSPGPLDDDASEDQPTRDGSMDEEDGEDGEEEETEEIEYKPLIRTVLPEMDLSGPFETYAPRKGGSDTEDEEAGRLQRRKGKGKVREVEKADLEQEGDDRLYCVCRRLYDNDRMMIACDKCENWYHLDCVFIAADRVDLVDQFICPVCSGAPGSREITTWKTRCARPTCLHPIAPLSKYCSTYCGLEMAATRLELCGIEPERFYPYVVGARRKEGTVQDVSLPPPPRRTHFAPIVDETSAEQQQEEDEQSLAELRSKLSTLVARRESLDASISFIDARRRYLAIAIKRWEALCQATADAMAAEGISMEIEVRSRGRIKKSRGPVAATSLPMAPCGLDVRLVYDDKEWEAWTEGEEGRSVLGAEAGTEEAEADIIAGVCLQLRKKCDRHTGWQKVRDADFEVEKAVLKRRADRLAIEEGKIRARIEDQEEGARFLALNRSRVGDAIPVAAHMKPSPRRPTHVHYIDTGRAVGGGLVGGTPYETPSFAAVPPIPDKVGPNGEYEIPDDVAQFLSRSEQRQRTGRR